MYASYYQNTDNSVFDRIKSFRFEVANRTIEDGNDDLDTPDVVAAVTESVTLTIQCRDLGDFAAADTTYGPGNTQGLTWVFYDAQGANTIHLICTGAVLMSQQHVGNWSELRMMEYSFRMNASSWTIKDPD